MTTDTSLDPAADVLAQVKYDHHQHVCSNHPEPGICTSRCHGRPWPCAPYRAAQAVEAALTQHHRSSSPTFGCGSGDTHGKHYCAGLCHVSINHDTLYEPWPCFPYLAILAALTGTTVVAITVRELAEHDAACPSCSPGLGSRPQCYERVRLASRWRRALREAGSS